MFDPPGKSPTAHHPVGQSKVLAFARACQNSYSAERPETIFVGHDPAESVILRKKTQPLSFIPAYPVQIELIRLVEQFERT